MRQFTWNFNSNFSSIF